MEYLLSQNTLKVACEGVIHRWSPNGKMDVWIRWGGKTMRCEPQMKISCLLLPSPASVAIKCFGIRIKTNTMHTMISAQTLVNSHQLAWMTQSAKIKRKAIDTHIPNLSLPCPLPLALAFVKNTVQISSIRMEPLVWVCIYIFKKRNPIMQLWHRGNLYFFEDSQH